MPLFNVTLDVKETIWHRCSAQINAYTLEEAQYEITQRRENDDYENMDSNYMLETGQPLTEIEIFLLNNQDLCLPNSPEFVDEIDAIKIYDFVREENYEMEGDEE